MSRFRRAVLVAAVVMVGWPGEARARQRGGYFGFVFGASAVEADGEVWGAGTMSLTGGYVMNDRANLALGFRAIGGRTMNSGEARLGHGIIALVGRGWVGPCWIEAGVGPAERSDYGAFEPFTVGAVGSVGWDVVRRRSWALEVQATALGASHERGSVVQFILGIGVTGFAGADKKKSPAAADPAPMPSPYDGANDPSQEPIVPAR